MKVKDLIDVLQSINPEMQVRIFDRDECEFVRAFDVGVRYCKHYEEYLSKIDDCYDYLEDYVKEYGENVE